MDVAHVKSLSYPAAAPSYAALANASLIAIEQAPDAIIVTDKEGEIQIWNKRAKEIFGFSKDEAVQGGLDLIIPENLRPAHWRGFSSAMAAGEVKSRGAAIRTRARHKDGRKIYVDLSFAVLTGPAGDAIGAIATARTPSSEHPTPPRPASQP
jgi:PAS domain S-box-containing protein